jgi:hypothetical protein
MIYTNFGVVATTGKTGKTFEMKNEKHLRPSLLNPMTTTNTRVKNY